jgi:acetylornithine deacetylase/succinyl-diaminopimelate desuccinylase-like protein
MPDEPKLDEVLSTLDAGLPQAQARLLDFLRIPSISTDPAHRGDVRRRRMALRGTGGLGFDASIRDTPGHPMVVAHSQKGDRRPVLFYGHYDVQPVDPLDLWDSPPFEPGHRGHARRPGHSRPRRLG